MKIVNALRMLNEAPLVRARGMLTRELEDVMLDVQAPADEFCILNWPSMMTNLKYLKAELAWYLKGDRYDLSICDHAKIWAEHVQNNVLESQYGHYWFRERAVVRALQFLREDPYSRRAVVPMIQPRHMSADAKDVPCTLCMTMRIRSGALNMSVHMRSQDAIFGLRNDLPAFAMVQCIAAAWLDVRVGSLTIKADSFHVYERHFDVLSKIIAEPLSYGRFPLPTRQFAQMVFLGDGYDARVDTGPDAFAEWLHDRNRAS